MSTLAELDGDEDADDPEETEDDHDERGLLDGGAAQHGPYEAAASVKICVGLLRHLVRARECLSLQAQHVQNLCARRFGR